METVKKNTSNSSGTLSYSAITLITLAIIVFPIPPIILDYIILLNIVFSVLLILYVFFGKKTINHFSFFNILLKMIVFNFVINLIITRQIITLGDGIESILIRFTVSVLSFDGYGILLIFFIILIVYASYFIFKILYKMYRVLEAALQSSIDSKHKMILLYDKERFSGIMSDKNIEEKITNMQQDTDIYELFDDANKILIKYEKLRVILIFANSALGIFAGMRFREELYFDAMIIYIPLAVAGGVLLIIPSLIMSVLMQIMFKRKHEATSKNSF